MSRWREFETGKPVTLRLIDCTKYLHRDTVGSLRQSRVKTRVYTLRDTVNQNPVAKDNSSWLHIPDNCKFIHFFNFSFPYAALYFCLLYTSAIIVTASSTAESV